MADDKAGRAVAVGRFLFRRRGAIGVGAYAAVFLLSRPVPASCLVGLGPVLLGLGLRFWAMGYIGRDARAGEIGASARVRSGPYRLLRHPIYLGNLLLVSGSLWSLVPPLWLAGVVLAGFIVEYGLIVVAEERHIARVEAARPRFSAARALPEWRTWVATAAAWSLALGKACVLGRPG
jgi:protein-S-isoprenylcysteine O-methyltransferase Ste14